MPPREPAPVQVATAHMPDAIPDDAADAARSVEIVDECLVMDICVDRYLWTLYQRTPKLDTIKEHERRKVTVKRKRKTLTVTRTFTKLVDEDFAWKDPKAADRSGMTMMDYVIGGMDRSFKLKLFYMLHAAEEAGLSPGITSAFRDDYRQSIASGLKAAANRSYHGGSLRGGYGHGLAADLVSVDGATKAQRWISTEASGNGSTPTAMSLASADPISARILRTLDRSTARNMPTTMAGRKLTRNWTPRSTPGSPCGTIVPRRKRPGSAGSSKVRRPERFKRVHACIPGQVAIPVTAN